MPLGLIVLIVFMGAMRSTREGTPGATAQPAQGGANGAWRAATTGNGQPLATWTESGQTTEADIRVPAQGVALTATNHSSGSAFNLCLFERERFRDGSFTIAFRADDGRTDQGGGPVWRVKDEQNYYVCRANPLEDNFRLYVVRDGKRRQLATADVKVAARAWHTIRVTHEGDRIRCVLDGKTTLESRDATLAGPGALGLWTKADARASFAAPATWWGATGPAQSPALDTAAIEAATGLKGTMFEEEPGAPVFKVSQPRADVPIVVEGRRMEPFMGFTSWAAFRAGGKAEAMMAGDLVVFQDEVSPVIDALFAEGCTVTALHNHFMFDEPRVFFMHIGGEGKAAQLAAGVRSALDAIKAVRATAPSPSRAAGFGGSAVPTGNAITPGALDAILFPEGDGKGTAKDGMYKAVFGRAVRMSCGCEIGREMGVNTWAAFCGRDEHAAISGDFVTFPGELQPVLRALRKAGIHIVTIHNHMEGEAPPSIFLHYWGKGRAADLARGVRAALDALASEAP